jgi:2-iminobutanoate/2-iminopropanoate deaminase
MNPQSKGKVTKQKIVTDRAPKPVGPYNQAMVAGNTVYVAGQVAINPQAGKIVATTFEEQAVQVFENIKAILEAAGSSPAEVVRVGVFLTDLGNFAKLNEIYSKYFGPDFPARTTVGVQLGAGMLIEVDCVALKHD